MGSVGRLLTEFRDFAFSGNVVDSLVENPIMPLIAALFGQPSSDDLAVSVTGSPITYGASSPTWSGSCCSPSRSCWW